jgi:ketosteroid isomerase-like protein
MRCCAVWLALLGVTGASSGAGESVAPAGTVAWFRSTEEALTDSMARGAKAEWDFVMEPDCVVTTEEGEVLTKAGFLDALRPLPPGLEGEIAVKDLTVQQFGATAVVRYLADEREAVFGQHLMTQYRVTHVYRPGEPGWRMVASHTSVVTQDPPAQPVSARGWPGLVGTHRLLPDGWTFRVELRDGRILGGRDPGNLRPFIALTPDAFVLSGRLGDWIFVVESGTAVRLVSFRKFGPLVWTRIKDDPS